MPRRQLRPPEYSQGRTRRRSRSRCRCTSRHLPGAPSRGHQSESAGCRRLRALTGCSSLALNVPRRRPSFRPVGFRHVEPSLIAAPGDPYAPGIAAHLAVLDETAGLVRFEEDLDLLSAVRTDDDEGVAHERLGPAY